MAKVYIVNKGSHDFSAARRVGELVFMTEGFQPRFGVAAAHRNFEFSLASSTDADWLLPTSLSLLNMVAASIFARKHGRLNLLLFDGKGYIKRTLIFNDDGKGEEDA